MMSDLAQSPEQPSQNSSKNGLDSAQSLSLNSENDSIRESRLFDSPESLGDELLDECYTSPIHLKRGGRTKRKRRSRCHSKRYIKAKRVGKWYVTLRWKMWDAKSVSAKSVMCKTPWAQMWGLHSFIRKGEEKKMVPLVFALMSRRRARDYKAILHTV